ncbi:MAG: hypothetical protein IT314_06490 [Anaerolineales bacterium]|nr:hypothetical protein [Anaerolineales bacterium]
MNIEEIQQAIAKLSPDELTQLRQWLREYQGEGKVELSEDAKESIREKVRRLRGSLKGTGAMKALMEEKRRERHR